MTLEINTERRLGSENGLSGCFKTRTQSDSEQNTSESKSEGKSADVYHLTFPGRFGDVGTFDRANMRPRILSRSERVEKRIFPHHGILINQIKIHEIRTVFVKDISKYNG